MFLWGCFLLIGQTDAPEPANRELSITPEGGEGVDNDIEERSAGSSVPGTPGPTHTGQHRFYISADLHLSCWCPVTPAEAALVVVDVEAERRF